MTEFCKSYGKKYSVASDKCYGKHKAGSTPAKMRYSPMYGTYK